MIESYECIAPKWVKTKTPTLKQRVDLRLVHPQGLPCKRDFIAGPRCIGCVFERNAIKYSDKTRGYIEDKHDS